MIGGWKRSSDGIYPDCNDFLLLNLYHRFGSAGVRAFAGNTRAILHNTVAARFARTNSPQGVRDFHPALDASRYLPSPRPHGGDLAGRWRNDHAVGLGKTYSSSYSRRQSQVR